MIKVKESRMSNLIDFISLKDKLSKPQLALFGGSVIVFRTIARSIVWKLNTWFVSQKIFVAGFRIRFNFLRKSWTYIYEKIIVIVCHCIFICYKLSFKFKMIREFLFIRKFTQSFFNYSPGVFHIIFFFQITDGSTIFLLNGCSSSFILLYVRKFLFMFACSGVSICVLLSVL